jgi:hypothetical protein
MHCWNLLVIGGMKDRVGKRESFGQEVSVVLQLEAAFLIHEVEIPAASGSGKFDQGIGQACGWSQYGQPAGKMVLQA